MTVLTQGVQPLEFLLSEADGMRARDNETVTVAGSEALVSGRVLAKLIATGKWVAYDDVGADGSEVAAGVLGTALPGVNGDYKALVFTRDCEVIGSMLNWGALAGPAIANGKADLKAVGVIVR